MRSILVVTAAGVVAAGCATATPGPGMAFQVKREASPDSGFEEAARVSPAAGQRALLVLHPRAACSGSAREVFTSAEGAFLGAVGPGEAALLVLPAKTKTVLSFSSVELTANPGSWYAVDTIEVPPEPSGLVLSPSSSNSRHCGSGQYADVSIATKAELELKLGEDDVRWLEPRPAEGQAWLDAHRSRVKELLGTSPVRRDAVVTRVHVP